MHHRTTKHPRRISGLAIRVLFALAVAGLPGCGDQSPTDPEEPAAQAVQPDELAADLTADQSVANPAAAGALAATATRLPKSFFVNPITGKDTNAGTKLQPFKTLARSLSSAIAGDTMRLASGIYSAATNGEKFTDFSQQVPVPAGVTILGTLAEDFTSQLHGTTGNVGLLLQGGATVKNLVLTGFGTAITASQGVQVLKTVVLDQNSFGLQLTGSARATLASSRLFLNPPIGNSGAVGANLQNQAQLTMTGGTISGAGQNCRTEVVGVSLDGAARLRMKSGVTLKDIAGTALVMDGTSKALLTGLTTIDRSFSELPGGCTPAPSVLTFGSASLTLRKARIFSTDGTSSVGIEAHSSAPLTLDTAQVTGHSAAGIKAIGTPTIVATASLFNDNDVGIDAVLAPQTKLTVKTSTLTGNTMGIRAPSFKLRNSHIAGNQLGIVVTSPSADLGQTFDPGNNTIDSNNITGVEFFPDVAAGNNGKIFASGNTWNKSTQGSDASGHYPTKPLLSGASPSPSGKNFQLPVGNSNFQIQL